MSLWINVTAKEDVCVPLCVLCLLSEAAHTECKSETEREPLRKAMRRRKIQEWRGERKKKR